MIGKEFRNVTSDTWINYAPARECHDRSEGRRQDPQTFAGRTRRRRHQRDLQDDCEAEKTTTAGRLHGIVFVPNVLPRTPPYIDRVINGSPAHKAKLQPDDLVVYVDGEPIYSIQAFKDM